MTIPKVQTMIKNSITIALILLLSSCMTVALEGDGDKTPGSKTQQEIVHGSLYKIQWSNLGKNPWAVEKCNNNVALKRVEFETNAIYILASVATLGLYVPQTVTWWCVGEKPADDPDETLYQPGA